MKTYPCTCNAHVVALFILSRFIEILNQINMPVFKNPSKIHDMRMKEGSFQIGFIKHLYYSKNYLLSVSYI